MRSTLGRARGLGSAKEGVGHWWWQRVTAVALVPLSLWFVASIVSLAGGGHDAVLAWLAQPVPAVLMLLLVIATYWHAALGMQVVVEDYVADEMARTVAVLIVKLLLFALGVAAAFAVLRIAI